ncbi:MAG: Hsp20/alpha crystallin family protein [Dysgonamonadaceae bacterium]|jgi:HSP20 family protein|nr:Hsp20/alpha crystallin family protein [Dysgonamonadaceae bacterium]
MIPVVRRANWLPGILNDFYLRHEFSHSSFRQVMVLPDNVDVGNIKARVEDGVLQIEIPKVVKEEKAQPVRSIDIF